MPSIAQAQIPQGQPAEYYCSLSRLTPRETVVYADAATLPALKIALSSNPVDRLGIGQRERVRIILVLPNAPARELFNRCLPYKTPAELKAENDALTVIDRWANPAEKRVLNAKDSFLQSILVALSVQVSPEKADIIRAIALDKARYSDAAKTFRIVIASDMASSLPEGVVTSNDQQIADHARNLLKEVDIDLDLSAVAIYGELRSRENAPLSVLATFWSAFFTEAGAKVLSIGTSLPFSEDMNGSTVERLRGSWRPPGSTSRTGARLEGRFVWKQDGSFPLGTLKFIDSSGRFQRALIEGVRKCDQGTTCELTGSVTQDVPFAPKKGDAVFNKRDEFIVKSKDKGWVGSVEAGRDQNGPRRYAIELDQ